MPQTLHPFRLRRRADPHAEERHELMSSIEQTHRDLNRAFQLFNLHSDPDLIDACVYEINALQSRYAYLSRRLKELDQVAQPVP